MRGKIKNVLVRFQFYLQQTLFFPYMFKFLCLFSFNKNLRWIISQHLTWETAQIRDRHSRYSLGHEIDKWQAISYISGLRSYNLILLYFITPIPFTYKMTELETISRFIIALYGSIWVYVSNKYCEYWSSINMK